MGAGSGYTAYVPVTLSPFSHAGVAERYTRRSQKPLPSRACGFESHRRHHFNSPEILVLHYFILYLIHGEITCGRQMTPTYCQTPNRHIGSLMQSGKEKMALSIVRRECRRRRPAGVAQVGGRGGWRRPIPAVSKIVACTLLIFRQALIL